MEITVTHKTEIVSGKEYPLTVTRQHGLQEINVNGEIIQVVDVTIFESTLGRSLCYTRAGPEASPEARAARRRQIQEVATAAMIEQGFW